MSDLFTGLALTLHRPWPYLIFHLPDSEWKGLENRSWKPPFDVTGKYIAIHAGKTMSPNGFETAERVLDPRYAQEGVIGVVRVQGWVSIGRDGSAAWSRTVMVETAARAKHSKWLSSERPNVAWILNDRRALKAPIAVRGNRGLWPLPPAANEQIRAELFAA
jgi:hypothetical protein